MLVLGRENLIKQIKRIQNHKGKKCDFFYEKPEAIAATITTIFIEIHKNRGISIIKRF